MGGILVSLGGRVQQMFRRLWQLKTAGTSNGLSEGQLYKGNEELVTGGGVFFWGQLVTDVTSLNLDGVPKGARLLLLRRPKERAFCHNPKRKLLFSGCVTFCRRSFWCEVSCAACLD